MTSNAKTRIAALARWVLVTALLLAALAKLGGGYHPSAGVSKILYSLAAVVELGLAGALLSRRWWRVAACATVCFGAAVAVMPYVAPMRTCGCLGPWVTLSPHARVGAGLAICLLGGLALVLQPRAVVRGLSPMASSP